MRGSPIPNPAIFLSIVLLGGLGTAMMVAYARAAERDTAAIGPVTPLSTPAPTAPTPSPTPAAPALLPAPAAPLPPPARNTAATSADRHPAAPVQRPPLDSRPLILPAAALAGVGPPPEPRSALPLETDLQPPTPESSAPQAPTREAPTPAAKPPSS